MTSLVITRIDPWRVDATVDGRLVAYAIQDAYGWALMRRVLRERRGVLQDVIATVARVVDYGSTARRDARVGERLAEVAAGAR